MKSLRIFSLIAFLSLSLFGVFGMHTSMQGKDGGCIASTVQDSNCPYQVNSLDYLNFHLNAYHSFSSVVFGENVLKALLFSFSLLMLVILTFLTPHILRSTEFIFSKAKYRFRNSFYSHQKQKISRWLSLFENSPTVFS